MDKSEFPVLILQGKLCLNISCNTCAALLLVATERTHESLWIHRRLYLEHSSLKDIHAY